MCCTFSLVLASPVPPEFSSEHSMLSGSLFGNHRRPPFSRVDHQAILVHPQALSCSTKPMLMPHLFFDDGPSRPSDNFGVSKIPALNYRSPDAFSSVPFVRSTPDFFGVHRTTNCVVFLLISLCSSIRLQYYTKVIIAELEPPSPWVLALITDILVVMATSSPLV